MATFPMAIELPSPNGRVEFAEYKDFADWISRQIHYSRQKAQALGISHPLLQKLYVLENNLRGDPNKLDWAKITGDLVEIYGQLITSESSDAAFISSLLPGANHQSEAQSAAWCAIVGGQYEPHNVFQYYGVFQGIRHRNSITQRGVDVAARAESILGEALKALERANAEASSAADKALKLDSRISKFDDDARASLKTSVGAADTATNSQIEKMERQFEEELEKLRTKAKDIEETFRIKMALRKPVAIWTDRKKKHGWRAIGWGAILLLLISLGGIAFYCCVVPFVPDRVNFQAFPLGRVLAAAVLTALGLWVLRVVARLFLSNLHLATDCAEKEAMTTAFLSLRMDGALAGPDAEQAMLQTLFKSPGTGVMKEDANPSFLLAELQKLGK